MISTSSIGALAVAVILSGQAGTADADSSGAVTVSGAVTTPRTFTADYLAHPTCGTHTVGFETPAGPRSHVYQACPLEPMLADARPIGRPADKHPFLTLGILAVGADGYTAALSYGDVSSTIAHRPAMVAWAEDGTLLDRPTLVMPDDASGTRYVKQLTEIRVVALAE
ncbi:molybdopterin-binding oxidoreductase [Mycolicibacterium flavescens]|uniref:Molybdopterin-binding oxidoreductase n=1 Tax=Mycolicibacterium flavescens TaxID=1776 RepID=A0A1E3RR00_MYCFV|nr:hypothetical protein [Mycolicibacterium flavescens]MCV7283265.1 molybdopterin-binding oxidoreductase [Mycolicibacterium flavescens]ODQ91817.1 hypothetical protein BHQ18_02850 [Mycolicibacterium flavescens]